MNFLNPLWTENIWSFLYSILLLSSRSLRARYIQCYSPAFPRIFVSKSCISVSKMTNQWVRFVCHLYDKLNKKFLFPAKFFINFSDSLSIFLKFSLLQLLSSYLLLIYLKYIFTDIYQRGKFLSLKRKRRWLQFFLGSKTNVFRGAVRYSHFLKRKTNTNNWKGTQRTAKHMDDSKKRMKYSI